ncbi:MAG: hypothetical protein M3O02_04825, partial [Acidobacteriota bacterium]|nr:hypothetical protein [Acidobacteriota bacterium]
VRNARTHGWRWVLGLVVVPGVFYLYVIFRATELRVFTLLGTPALLLHGATGIRVLREWWVRGVVWQKAMVAALVLVFAGVMFGPVSVQMRDGPRSSTGQIWMPLVWDEWQASVTDGMRKLDGVIDEVGPGETMLALSTQFNVDRYFRVHLLEKGYDIVPFAEAPEACRGIAEVFRKGDRTVFHLRTEDPYTTLNMWWHLPEEYLVAFQVEQGLDCMKGQTYQHAVLLNWVGVSKFLEPVFQAPGSLAPAWETPYPTSRMIPVRKRDPFGEVYVEHLTPERVEGLRLLAHAEVEGESQGAAGWTPLTDYADLHEKVQPRFWPMPK